MAEPTKPGTPAKASAPQPAAPAKAPVPQPGAQAKAPVPQPGAQAKAPVLRPGASGKGPVPRTKPGVPPQKSKPKKKFPAALVVALLFLVLIAVTAGMVYFNVAGLKTMAVTAFKFNNPTREQLATLDQKQKALEQKQTALDEREKAISDAEAAQKTQLKDIKAREKTLADKDAALAEKDKAVADLQSQLDALKEQLNIKTLDLATAVKMFAGMDPRNAAKAMGGMKDPAQIALLLLYMDADKSAAILNKMKPALATSVMTEIAIMKAQGQLGGETGAVQKPSPTPQPSGG